MHKPYLIALFACIFSTAAAATEITVLGLPLGGKLEPTPKICKGSAPEQNMCWVSKPDKGPGEYKSGMVRLPTTDNLPAWAANAMFYIVISTTGDLGSIRVKTHSASDWDRIVKSIAARFGVPESNYESSAKWVSSELSVSVLCDRRSGCNVEFESAADYAERMRQVAEREKKDAARPKTP